MTSPEDPKIEMMTLGQNSYRLENLLELFGYCGFFWFCLTRSLSVFHWPSSFTVLFVSWFIQNLWFISL